MKLIWVVTVLGIAAAPAQEIRYNAAGELQRPDDYREWVFLSSGLGMTYGQPNPDGRPNFDNVYVNRASYREFVKTGKWPDKTIFALEIRAAETQVSINNGGHTQGRLIALEVAVKDEAKIPEKWGYYNFGAKAASTQMIPKTERCFTCHSTKAAVENTFVQFYPELLSVARAKGTLNAHYEDKR